MSIQATYFHRVFNFKRPSGTSRGVLTTKNSWFIELKEDGFTAIGECSVIEGLSPDYQTKEAYENQLTEVCKHLDKYCNDRSLLSKWPSILFGLETAILNLKTKRKGIYFDNDFSNGKRKIAINGLVWMGDVTFMHEQIDQKIKDGFSCIKMKIGAIDFDKEVEILKGIRSKFSKDQIELRVDANGAFSPSEAISKLETLAKYELHSIEQPIAVGQHDSMKKLCIESPLDIALDEELIGIIGVDNKRALLTKICPPFIILKPSLHGAISGCIEWIEMAEELNIKWWMTSALESNVGLDAIAQFAGEYTNEMPQGLGTGSLYTANFDSPLKVENGFIFRD